MKLSPPMVLRGTYSINAYIRRSVRANTYSWFYMFMIVCSQPMILTCWLRQNRYCLAIFYMKDLGEASYVLGIQILRYRPSGILRLSQQTYIECIMKRFNVKGTN